MHITAFKDRLSVLKKLVLATGIGVAVFLLVLVVHWSDVLRVVELKTLDYRFNRYAKPTQASADIVLVAIDEASLQAFTGRWPWSRDRHGYMVHYLHEAGARAIVFDILFFEPDEDEAFDREFASEIRAAGNVFLPFLMEQPTATPSQARVPPSAAPEAAVAPAARAMVRQATPRQASLRRYAGAKLPIPSWLRRRVVWDSLIFSRTAMAPCATYLYLSRCTTPCSPN